MQYCSPVTWLWEIFVVVAFRSVIEDFLYYLFSGTLLSDCPNLLLPDDAVPLFASRFLWCVVLACFVILLRKSFFNCKTHFSYFQFRATFKLCIKMVHKSCKFWILCDCLQDVQKSRLLLLSFISTHTHRYLHICIFYVWVSESWLNASVIIVTPINSITAWI